MRRIVLIGSITLSLTAALAQADVVPGRWEKLEARGPGKRVQITLKSLDRVEGILQSVTDNELKIRTGDGRQLQLRKIDVKSVTRRVRTSDRLTNGVLIGGLAGLGLGIAFAAPEDNDNRAVPVFAGLGVLFGVLIDATVNTRKVEETLYRSDE